MAGQRRCHGIQAIASLSLILEFTRAHAHGSGGPSSCHYKPRNLGMTHLHGTFPLNLGKSTANHTCDVCDAQCCTGSSICSSNSGLCTWSKCSHSYSPFPTLLSMEASKEGHHGSRRRRGCHMTFWGDGPSHPRYQGHMGEWVSTGPSFKSLGDCLEVPRHW